jgi:short-subunit dehydrogenase
MGPYCATKFAVVGYSESLYLELRARGSGVGVSVLCPGFVRTRIAESARNLPEELRTAGDSDGPSELEQIAAAVVAKGIEPSVVADRVAEAIASGEFWIFPHRHVAIRTTEQRLEWMQGGSTPTIDLDKATKGG